MRVEQLLTHRKNWIRELVKYLIDADYYRLVEVHDDFLTIKFSAPDRYAEITIIESFQHTYSIICMSENKLVYVFKKNDDERQLIEEIIESIEEILYPTPIKFPWIGFIFGGGFAAFSLIMLYG